MDNQTIYNDMILTSTTSDFECEENYNLLIDNSYSYAPSIVFMKGNTIIGSSLIENINWYSSCLVIETRHNVYKFTKKYNHSIEWLHSTEGVAARYGFTLEEEWYENYTHHYRFNRPIEEWEFFNWMYYVRNCEPNISCGRSAKKEVWSVDI